MFQIVHVTIHFDMDSLVEHRASLSLVPCYQCRAPGLLAPYYHCRVPGLLAPYPADPVTHHSTISVSRKGGTTCIVRSICEFF
jgi:hypothetical protein